MRAGKLRNVIEIQRYSEAQDSYGEMIRGWTTDITAHASIEPLNGRERFEAQQIIPDVTHTVIMRYQADVTPKHRVRFNGRTFNIMSVLNIDERNRELQLLCKENVVPVAVVNNA